jgi:hypothetical protein
MHSFNISEAPVTSVFRDNLCYTKLFLRLKINELTEEHGHKVLHMPLYHWLFGPSEMAWAQAKRQQHRSKWVWNGSSE